MYFKYLTRVPASIRSIEYPGVTSSCPFYSSPEEQNSSWQGMDILPQVNLILLVLRLRRRGQNGLLKGLTLSDGSIFQEGAEVRHVIGGANN